MLHHVHYWLKNSVCKGGHLGHEYSESLYHPGIPFMSIPFRVPVSLVHPI